MNNKFDKNFEDLGWSEMQKLLDRELPVAGKKRRGFAFWLFSIGGLMLISSGIYFGLNTKESIANSVLVNELNTKKSIANSALVNELNTKKSIANSALVNELNTKESIANSALVNELNTKESLVNNALVNELNTKKSIVNNALVNELSTKASPVNNAEINENRTPQYKSENGAILAENNHKLDFYYLKILEPQLFVIHDSSILNESIQSFFAQKSSVVGILTPIDKSSKIRFGVSAGVHTEIFSGIGGGQIGLIANKNLRKNWSINAGFNYRKASINTDKLTYYQVELRYKSGASTLPNSVTTARKLTLNNLNYLELPIGFSYELNKKWSISSGIKTAYLLSVNVSIASDSTLFILQNNPSYKDASIVSADGSSNVKLLDLNRWDFSAIGGVHYNVTPKIQLSLRYDYGFRNVLNRANWLAYNRFVGFNAAYYFR